MLSAIVRAMVGRTGFVVTVTVLIVQMATDSFSPRLISVWLRDGMRRAMAMCIASGLILVYALQGTVSSTTTHALTPVGDLVLAAAALIVAYLLGSGAVWRIRERRAVRRDKPKKDPRWERRMRSGTATTAFVLGVALSFPGATYLLLLDRLSKLHYSVVVTTPVLIGSNLIPLIVLEVPMLAFAMWPRETPNAIDRAKAWIGRHGRQYAAVAAVVIGVALLVRGVTRAW